MSRSTNLIRPLVAAAAALALAAPVASAAPIDVHSPGHPSQDVHSVPAQPENTDMRSPDAYDAATRGSELQKSDAPVYWSYDYQATNPKYAAALAQEQAYSSFVKAKPIPAAAATDDDDTPWAIIGLGITGGLLALLGAATVAVKTRARRVQRVAV
jgi:hypothetical protein